MDEETALSLNGGKEMQQDISMVQIAVRGMVSKFPLSFCLFVLGYAAAL